MSISTTQRNAIDLDMLVLRTLAATNGASAIWLARQLGWERGAVSYRLGRLRKLRAVEHDGAWGATAVGRALLDLAASPPSPPRGGQ